MIAAAVLLPTLVILHATNTPAATASHDNDDKAQSQGTHHDGDHGDSETSDHQTGQVGEHEDNEASDDGNVGHVEDANDNEIETD